VGRQHGLDACIKVNGGTFGLNLVATAVEAILEAVERDGGHEALVQAMAHLGHTQHALFSSVTFYPLHHLLYICRSAASYLLDLLGPSVEDTRCPYVGSPWSLYAVEEYRPG